MKQNFKYDNLIDIAKIKITGQITQRFYISLANALFFDKNPPSY